ncbi:MAG TPA: cation-translocating P-type ATPase [Dehalococcoidia bacterium]|nr:cation-translocating P-type ATPase [Dehalococcoidia bacterium]
MPLPAGSPAAETTLQGLSDAEAARRLKEAGPNELPHGESRSPLATALGVLGEPMILLLLIAGTVYLVLGDRTEAIILLASIGLIVVIDLYQERRTERALEALRDLASPRALVLREGRSLRIPGREVVPGDLMVLSEGDRVAADATLLTATNVQVDESLLTGESIPVAKSASAPGAAADRADSAVFAGTVVTRGQGLALVTATGAGTEMGRIGRAMHGLRPERTRLQDETARVVRFIAIGAISLCVVIAVGTAIRRGSVTDGLLAGISVAMALIPEEFPIVLTVFLALGAWRIARRNVLARRIPAIEALGTVTVLCADKTGTLTENRMAVVRIATKSGVHDVSDGALPAELAPLVRTASLASESEPADPMERAINALAGRQDGPATDPGDRVRVYPLSERLLVVAHAWRSGDGAINVAGKGAPEAVMRLCGLDERSVRAMTVTTEQLAADGLRVLGVAHAEAADAGALPDELSAFHWAFDGLIALADPLRAAVPAAVEECHRAGIRVVMLTGDYPATARAIAKQAGIAPLDPVLTGTEITTLDDDALRHQVRDVAVFARVRPEQKLRLVRALQANGEIVAMTGDGVNDAPALKAAEVGIAMGQRGTDVAREAAAVVLADDNFASIVGAVRLGRRIFDNLRRAMAFLLAVHVPIAGLALLPLLVDWPLILTPVHIVFLELVIDPVCSIGFESEPEEPNVMRRPPRSRSEPLFDRRTVALSLAQGLGVLAAAGGVLAVARWQDLGFEEGRTLAFTTLVVASIGIIFANRAGGASMLASIRVPNRTLRLIVALGALLLLAVLAIEPARALFAFTPLDLRAAIMIAVASTAALLWLGLLRRLGRRAVRVLSSQPRSRGEAA